MMPVRVDDEGGIIARSVVRSQTGSTIVAASVFECRLMKAGDSVLVRSRQSQVEARAGWPQPFRPELDRQFIAATGWTIANRLVGFSRPQVFPGAHISEWGKGSS